MNVSQIGSGGVFSSPQYSPSLSEYSLFSSSEHVKQYSVERSDLMNFNFIFAHTKYMQMAIGKIIKSHITLCFQLQKYTWP